ncbi:MAG TPA: histidine phosphatase family protein [Chloroflexia bacterium]|nr:histidine phosphatase family protein [Chloroflexia bacterium]
MNSGHHDGRSDLQISQDETLLYLVRHAETAWNVERRFQGQFDVQLNSMGEEQAEQVANWIASQPVRFTAIYSSDLHRARATVRPISARLRIEPSYSAELRELNCGEWQGLTVEKVEEKYPGELQRWREDICGYTLPGGESIPDVQRRINGYLDDTIKAHRGEAIIVVSHGAALSAYIAATNVWDLQETWDTRRARMSNTGVTAIAISHTSLTHRMLFFNSIEHLPGHTDLPSVIDPLSTGRTGKAAAEFAV